MSNTQPNPRSAMFRKIAKFREIVNKQDWANDKTVSIPSRGTGPSGYGYLSVDKIKKTMAPIFVEAGLDFKPDLVSAENDTSLGKNHWTVTMNMILTDIDTGETDETKVMGEAMDNQDKGLIKAQSYAMKTYFVNKFSLADGMDPDKIASDYESFRTRTPEEIAEMRKKVLEKGEKPAPKAEEPEKAPAPAPAPEAPKKAVPAPKKTVKKEAPKPEPESVPEEETGNEPAPAAEAPKKEVRKAAPKKAAPKEETGMKEGGELFKPSGPLESAVKNIVDSLTEKAKAGNITPEDYNAMSADRATMASDADAKVFIRKYRSMTR